MDSASLAPSSAMETKTVRMEVTRRTAVTVSMSPGSPGPQSILGLVDLSLGEQNRASGSCLGRISIQMIPDLLVTFSLGKYGMLKLYRLETHFQGCRLEMKPHAQVLLRLLWGKPNKEKTSVCSMQLNVIRSSSKKELAHEIKCNCILIWLCSENQFNVSHCQATDLNIL